MSTNCQACENYNQPKPSPAPEGEVRSDAQPKPAGAQCTDCSVDAPYEEEIQAGGVLCGGCGRTRPNIEYRIARTVPEGEVGARAIIQHIADAALELAFVRHDLASNEIDEELGDTRERFIEEVKRDTLNCLTGDDIGCLSEEELDETNCVMLWLKAKLIPHPAPVEASAKLIASLREAVTVLDEPFHRETVATQILEAADALEASERARTKLACIVEHFTKIIEERDILKQQWEEKQGRFSALLKEREVLASDLAINASLLAHQTDLAREAERQRDIFRRGFEAERRRRDQEAFKSRADLEAYRAADELCPRVD